MGLALPPHLALGARQQVLRLHWAVPDRVPLLGHLPAVHGRSARGHTSGPSVMGHLNESVCRGTRLGKVRYRSLKLAAALLNSCALQ